MSRDPELNTLVDTLYKMWLEDTTPFPYADVRAIQQDFERGFIRFARGDFSLSPDLNYYWMFIAGLASGEITNRLKDSHELCKVQHWLTKSFYDWYPKYRFLQFFDLSKYRDFQHEYRKYESMRTILLKVIQVYKNE